MNERIKIFEAEYDVNTDGLPIINFYYDNYWVGTYENEFFDGSTNYSYAGVYEPLVYDYLKTVGLPINKETK